MLNVVAGDEETNGVPFVRPQVAGKPPSLAGRVDGKDRVGTSKGTVTRSGQSGTFASPTPGILGTAEARSAAVDGGAIERHPRLAGGMAHDDPKNARRAVAAGPR